MQHMFKKLCNRILLSILTLIVTISVALGGYALYLHFTNNFHVVIPNTVYRSRLLSKTDLQTTVQSKRIKTIIDISHTRKDYEKQFVTSHKIKFIYIPVGAHGTASKQQLRYLWHSIQNSPKPILIHCIQGADRTGLAAAIAIIALQPNYKTAEWQQQMTFRYGVLSPHTIGYHVLYPYYRYLQHSNKIDNQQTFIYWLNNIYQPTQQPFGWWL